MPDKPSGLDAQWNVEFNLLENPEWRSILVLEDKLVAALQKSLERNGNHVEESHAWQAIRDIEAELFSGIEASGFPNATSLIAQIKKALTAGDGQDEEKRFQPPPAP